jgi:hypothetical protein
LEDLSGQLFHNGSDALRVQHIGWGPGAASPCLNSNSEDAVRGQADSGCSGMLQQSGHTLKSSIRSEGAGATAFVRPAEPPEDVSRYCV